MQNHFVRNGLYMGLCSIIFTMIFYFISPEFMMGWGSYLGFLITLFFMVQAVSATKKDQLGFISLSEAFKSGWLSYVLGSVISSVFMFILVNYVDVTLIDTLKQIQLEAIEKAGTFFKLPEDQLQEQMAVIEDTNPFGLAQVALAIPFSFLFPGAIIAIIIAAFMKKNDPNIGVV